MSKFLKFIVHFIVICTIVCVVGLAVPPFLGITTEIMDDSGKETNLPMGSVTYAIPVKIKEAAVGDSILYQTDSKAYRYMITEMDKKNHIFKVIDSSDKDAEPVAVEVKDYIPKVVITVGYAGYLLLATESIEGLIILGLAVLFLVILYIVAELLKKEPQDDYDETDTEPGYVKSKKELKREEKAREKRYKEEERQIKKEERARRKGKAPERKKIKTGGFVDEIYEDELEPVKPAQPETIQTATSEAHELLRKEIAAATADVPVKQEESVQTKPDAGDIHMEPVSGKTEVIVPQVKEQLKKLMKKLEEAGSGEEQFAVHKEFYKLNDRVQTQVTLCSIRHTIDTTDEFYEKEQNYYDEQVPEYSNLCVEYQKRLFASPYRDVLEEKIGPVAFKNMEIAMKSVSEEVIPLMQEENALVTEYEKLLASAKIDWEGETLNL